MNLQLLVIAKAPVPGQVKTRLCPPCTPEQAARLAAAALSDTLTVARQMPVTRHTIVHHGHIEPPAGWRLVPQRGDGLAARLANAFVDTARPATGSLLIGMDTPQVTPQLLTGLAHGLDDHDAVLGPAQDGGWWVLALRDPYHARVLREVPMSTVDTGARTAAALTASGLRLGYGPVLRDVDTVADARAVSEACPHGRFADAVRRHVPAVPAA